MQKYSKMESVKNYIRRLKNASSLKNNLSYLKYFGRTTSFMLREITASRNFILSDLERNRYLTPLNNFTSFYTYVHGARDPHILKFLRNYVRNGDVVIDVGANIGAYTFPCSRFVGDKGLVVAYEPNPEMCSCMDYSLQFYPEGNIVIRGVALGSRKELVSLQTNWTNRGASTVKYKDEKYLRGNYVNCIDLDSDFHLIAVDKSPKVIKIDVEGFEGNVIHGAKKIISNSQDLVIVMEHLPETASRSESGNCAVTILKEIGYHPYCIDSQGNPLPTDSTFGDNLVWARDL